jgi:hypothetical protein
VFALVDGLRVLISIIIMLGFFTVHYIVLDEISRMKHRACVFNVVIRLVLGLPNSWGGYIVALFLLTCVPFASRDQKLFLAFPDKARTEHTLGGPWRMNGVNLLW